MSTPFFDLIEELRALGGAPKVTYPRGDTGFPVTERTIKAKRGQHILTLGTAEPDATRFPNNILTVQIELRADAQIVEVYRKYEALPGKLLDSAEISEWGPTTKTNQPVAYPGSLTTSSTTTSAAAAATDGVQSSVDVVNDNAIPTPWLFSYEIDPDTGIGTRVSKRKNANGMIGGITYMGATAITGAVVGNPVVLNFGSAIQTPWSAFPLRTGDIVNIAGDTNCTPSINGQWPVTVISSTSVSIPVNVTAVASSGYGTIQYAAPAYVEIQPLSFLQCIEIWSSIDTTTLAGAQKAWSDYIDYPWKEVIVGLDAFTDSGVGTTTNTGAWPLPTVITWHFSSNTDVQVGIRTARYTGKTFATMTRSYSIGAPTPDSVLQIRTSSGEIVMEGTSHEEHDALSVSTSTTGLQQSLSNGVHYKTARIEDVLTNGFVTGSTIGALITLKMDASSPSTFTAADTFTASCNITPGRLGLYLKESVTVTVPTPFPA